MTVKQDYELKISVDAGFSRSKVVVESGKHWIGFDVPNSIVEITGRDMFIAGLHKPDFICTTYVQGAKHLVGEQARMLLAEPEYKELQRSKKDIMNEYEKFTLQESNIHLMTCIGMALIKYAEYTKENHIKPELDLSKPLDENSLFKIKVILGYPHDVFGQVYRSVKPNVARNHKFSIETETQTYELDFTIDNDNIMSYSQAVAMYMGIIMDDNGSIDKDCKYLEKLPALVNDGGQKTFGIFKVMSNMQVEAAESNTLFAMNNVFEKVVQELHEEYGRTDIEIYNIEEILKNENGQIVYVDAAKDSTSTLDIKPIVDKYMDEICTNLIDYLNERHNNLVGIKGIFIGGGTGAAYYNSMKAYFEKHRKHVVDDLYLVEYKYMGKQVDPVYAIAVGLMKVLKYSLRLEETTDEE